VGESLLKIEDRKNRSEEERSTRKKHKKKAEERNGR